MHHHGSCVMKGSYSCIHVITKLHAIHFVTFLVVFRASYFAVNKNHCDIYFTVILKQEILEFSTLGWEHQVVLKSPGNIRTVRYIEKLKNIPEEGNFCSLPYCCKLHGCIQKGVKLGVMQGEIAFYTASQNCKWIV